MNKNLIAGQLVQAARDIVGGQGPLEKIAQKLFSEVKKDLDQPIVGRAMTLSGGVSFYIGGTYDEGGYNVVVGINVGNTRPQVKQDPPFVWGSVEIKQGRKKILKKEFKKDRFAYRSGREQAKGMKATAKSIADIINKETAKSRTAREIVGGKDASKLLNDAFGVTVKDGKTIGDSRYSVAVGSSGGKWYAVEVSGRNPQVWEARSKKALSSMLKKDSGVKLASTETERQAAREIVGGNPFFEPKSIDWNKMKFDDNKHWVYSFKGGGWNSELAKTKKEAVSKAKKRWSGTEFDAEDDTFRVPTRKEYNSLMRQFN